jgi:hypothetical protein
LAPAVAVGVLSAAASWFNIPTLENARWIVSLTSSIGPEVVSNPAEVSARRIVSAIFSQSTARKAALKFITSFSAMPSREISGNSIGERLADCFAALKGA